MSISSTIGQVAASNPIVGVAVAVSQVKSALVAGMQTGDTAMAGLLGALSTQAQTSGQLLASLPTTLGQSLDVRV